jgi:capsular exopolysaccharide synthesis family protein
MNQESLLEGIFRSLKKHAGWATLIVGLAVAGSALINYYFPSIYETNSILRVMTSETSDDFSMAASMNGVFSQKSILAELARDCGLTADEVIDKNLVSFEDSGAGIVKLIIRHENPDCLKDLNRVAIRILSEHFLLFSAEQREFEIKVARKKIEQLEKTLNQARQDLAKASVTASIKVNELTLQLENEMHQLEEKIDLNKKKLQTTAKSVFYYVEEETSSYKKYNTELKNKRNQLAELFKSYKEKHPRVIDCKEKIKTLEKKLKTARTKKRKQKTNPEYVALTSEIESDQEKLSLVKNELQRTSSRSETNESDREYKVANLNLRIRALEDLHKKALLDLEETRISQSSTQGKINVLKHKSPEIIGFSSLQRDCIALFSGVLVAIFLLYSPTPVRTEIVSVSGEALAGAIQPQNNLMLTAEPAEIILEVPSLSKEPLALPAPDYYNDIAEYDERLIALNNPESNSLNPYKALVANLQIHISETQTRIVLVNSARTGCGKTTLLANTAILLAQAGYSVLMVDANFRSPVLHRVFDAENNQGLAESLRTGLKSQYIQKTMIKNLFLLSSGVAPANPAELFGSPEMIEILGELKRKVEIILIDTAALLEHPDTGILAGQTGAMVFLHQESDSEEDLKAAKRIIKSIRAKIFGYVKT